eukprot:7323697-Pyramimonas_sp.AAC.1
MGPVGWALNLCGGRSLPKTARCVTRLIGRSFCSPPQSIDNAKADYAPLFSLVKEAVTRSVDPSSFADVHTQVHEAVQAADSKFLAKA